MADLRERFRELDALRPPDLRPRIRDRRPALVPEPPWRRFAAAAVALVLAAAGLTVVVRAFSARDSAPRPAGPVSVQVGGSPVDVAMGEGSVWVATVTDRSGRGEVVRIDPADGRVIVRIALPEVGAVAVGEGGVWVANLRSGTVTRIDPATNEVADVITMPPLPHEVSEGDDAFLPETLAVGFGRVWVSTARGAVASIDPDTGAVAIAAADPEAVLGGAATGAGRVWAWNVFEPPEAEVWRISPESAEIGRISVPAPVLAAAPGSDGLFVLHVETGDVSVVDADASLEPAVPVVDVGERGNAIAALDRVAYVAAASGNVYEIDRDSGQATLLRPLSAEPTAIEVGDGHLWVAAADGTVTPVSLKERETSAPPDRTEPPTPQVTRTIEVGPFPQSIAVGEGAVWVSIPAQEASEDDTLVRIDPETDRVVSRITTAEPLENLLAGQGGVWGTATEGSGPPYKLFLIKLDPVAEAVVARVPDVAGMAIGHGSIWGVRLGAEELVRVDAVTADEIATIPLPEAISHLVVGEGAVWAVTLEGQATDVLKIDPQTNRIVASLDIPTAGTTHHPAAGAGYLWLPMVSTDFDVFVLRVDPATVEIVGDTIPIKATGAFATDGEGLWLLDEKGRVERLNAGTLEIDARAKFEWPAATFQPTAVLDPTARTIWVANYRDTVTRIDLR